MKCEYLYCIVGPSGSGKTTLADELSKDLGIKQVASYTTRKPRYEGEDSHTFVTKEEFDKLGKMCAYTKRGDVEYGVTADLLDKYQLYVIDPPGLVYLKKVYRNRVIKTIGLTASEEVLRKRMLSRGDTEKEVQERLEIDKRDIGLDTLIECCDIIVPTKTIKQTREVVKAYIVGTETVRWAFM